MQIECIRAMDEGKQGKNKERPAEIALQAAFGLDERI